jgi:anti-anti-sigma regulatory factor
MPWSVEPERDQTMLSFRGSTDVLDAASLHGVLLDLSTGPLPVVVDLSAASEVDCAILQLLLAFHRERTDARAPVRFVPGQGGAARLLSRLGLRQQLTA